MSSDARTAFEAAMGVPQAPVVAPLEDSPDDVGAVPEVEQVEVPETVAPPPPSPAARAIDARNIFSSADAHPLVLEHVLIHHFGREWLDWVPETVYREVELTLKTSIAEVNKGKIAAVMAMHVTTLPWEQWQVFERTIHALQGGLSAVDMLHPPTLDELYVGVSIMNMVRGHDFSAEIACYCAAVHLHEEVTATIPPLDFCAVQLAEPLYHCNTCGTLGSAAPPFSGQCASCSGQFSGGEFSPVPPPNAHVGRDVELLQKYDPKPVLDRFHTLDKTPGDISALLQALPEDVQAGHLIAAKESVEHWQTRCDEQLARLGDFAKLGTAVGQLGKTLKWGWHGGDPLQAGVGVGPKMRIANKALNVLGATGPVLETLPKHDPTGGERSRTQRFVAGAGGYAGGLLGGGAAMRALRGRGGALGGLAAGIAGSIAGGSVGHKITNAPWRGADKKKALARRKAEEEHKKSSAPATPSKASAVADK